MNMYGKNIYIYIYIYIHVHIFYLYIHIFSSYGSLFTICSLGINDELRIKSGIVAATLPL